MISIPKEKIKTEKTTSTQKHQQGITIEDARKLASFSDWNEEQLSELVNYLKSFCLISYKIWSDKQKQIPQSRAG